MSALKRLALAGVLCSCEPAPAPAPAVVTPQPCRERVYDFGHWYSSDRARCPHEQHALELVGDLALCRCKEPK